MPPAPAATATTSTTSATSTMSTTAGSSDTSTQPAGASVAPTTSATTPATTAAPATTAPAADVVVDGAVYHNKWGDVQVEATFAADGTLVDVTALRTPGRSGSERQHQQLTPCHVLNSEALSAQSANVDTVSGATYTSNDYRRPCSRRSMPLPAPASL